MNLIGIHDLEPCKKFSDLIWVEGFGIHRVYMIVRN